MRELAYEHHWNDWEEGRSIEIFQVGDTLILHDSGHCVWEADWDCEQEISWEEAIKLIDDIEQNAEGIEYVLCSHRR